MLCGHSTESRIAAAFLGPLSGGVAAREQLHFEVHKAWSKQTSSGFVEKGRGPNGKVGTCSIAIMKHETTMLFWSMRKWRRHVGC